MWKDAVRRLGPASAYLQLVWKLDLAADLPSYIQPNKILPSKSLRNMEKETTTQSTAKTSLPQTYACQKALHDSVLC